MIKQRHRATFVPPESVTGSKVYDFDFDPGTTFRKGAVCASYATKLAAMAGNVPNASSVHPDRLFEGVCSFTGVSEEFSRKHGTTLMDNFEMFCMMASRSNHYQKWVTFDHEHIPAWVFKRGPVACVLKWNYQRVGMIGNVARRSPLENPSNHAVAIIGIDMDHEIGWNPFNLLLLKNPFKVTKAPCYLVLNPSTRFVTWIRASDIHQTGDCLQACAFL